MKPNFQTMVLKFIKEDGFVLNDYFEETCKKDIDKLCLDYNMEVTNMTFYERTKCLTATLKRKREEVKMVIK